MFILFTKKNKLCNSFKNLCQKILKSKKLCDKIIPYRDISISIKYRCNILGARRFRHGCFATGLFAKPQSGCFATDISLQGVSPRIFHHRAFRHGTFATRRHIGRSATHGIFATAHARTFRHGPRREVSPHMEAYLLCDSSET